MARKQSSALVFCLLLGVVVLIGYGSLYPFDFRFDGSQPTLMAAFSQLSWARAGRADRVRNVLLYLPLGFCLMLLLRVKLGAFWASMVATLLGMILSLAIELSQVYLSMRVPSLMDVMLNTSGTWVGAIAGVIWRGLSGLVYMSPNSRSRPGDRSALVLVCTWMLWRLAEFEPGVTLSRLKLALWPLMEGSYSLALTCKFLLLWLVVAQAVLSFANRHRSNEALLTVIAVVMIGRLLFIVSPFNFSELLALLLLLPVLVILHKFNGKPQALMLMLGFFAWFIYQRIFPFQFTTNANHFDWWPFVNWLEQGMPINPDQLLSKLFLFGALIWLLKETGLSIRTAMIVVVLMIFGLEVLQLWIKDQTGSITDAALALVMGTVMRLASNERKIRSTRFKHA